MSIDFQIEFPVGGRPDAEQVRCVVEDYLGAVLHGTTAVKEEWWAFRLRGSPSFPFRRIESLSAFERNMTFPRDHRFVEYCHATTSFIVRQTDEFTLDVAASLARVVARFWNGECLHANGP